MFPWLFLYDYWSPFNFDKVKIIAIYVIPGRWINIHECIIVWVPGNVGNMSYILFYQLLCMLKHDTLLYFFSMTQNRNLHNVKLLKKLCELEKSNLEGYYKPSMYLDDTVSFWNTACDGTFFKFLIRLYYIYLFIYIYILYMVSVLNSSRRISSLSTELSGKVLKSFTKYSRQHSHDLSLSLITLFSGEKYTLPSTLSMTFFCWSICCVTKLIFFDTTQVGNAFLSRLPPLFPNAYPYHARRPVV